MEKIISEIQANRKNLVDSAIETVLTSGWSSDIKITAPELEKIFDNLFASLEKDLAAKTENDFGKYLYSNYLRSVKSLSVLKNNFHTQLTILGMARTVINHFLSNLTSVGMEEIRLKFSMIQKIFDHTLIELSQWWGQIYEEFRISDQKLIQELKIVKDGLQKHLNVIYQIINESPVGVVDCDSELIVKHWNPMAVRLTGFQPNEILKKSVLYFIADQSRQKFLEKIRGGRKWIPNLRLFIKTKNDLPIPVIFSISKIKNVNVANIVYIINFQSSGNQAGFKSNVQQLNQLTAIARLTSAIMHDIRNPLNSIGLNLDVLEQQLVEQNENLLTKEHKNLIARIQNEIVQLSSNLNHYITYSHLSQLQLEPLDMNRQLKIFTDESRFELSHKNIKFILRTGRSACRIMGDWLQLRRVFANIVQNSAEAINSDGIIKIVMQKRGSRVIISIKDNGEGLDPHKKTQIFEPFFSTKKSGTGLGLFISREIVMAHRGKISCRSGKDTGTLFTISFPLVTDEGDKRIA
ncbi:MAG: PAS domain-containing sensor histidine kinase [Calditrichaceae bacterium]